jgi:putative ABC transport system permease protein
MPLAIADVRYAARVFLRQPLRTAIAVVTLSMAIGANTAIFSVLNAVMFRPFPFPEADRIVLVVERVRTGGGTSPTIPEILDLRARSRTLDTLTFFDTRDFQVEGGAEPLRVLGARIDPAFLPLVGARPAHGRLFTAEDSDDGSPDMVLLSDGLWRRSFAADPAVVGRPFVVNGATHTIAGVLSPEFRLSFLSGEPEIYVPYPLTPTYTLRTAEFANVRRVFTIGRLAPGVSRTTASAELETIAVQLATEHPALYADLGGASNFVIDVEPLRESIAEAGHSALWMLFGAVGLVLLIGCANAAQFLLAHAIEREPEVALRGALGASRGRLVRQFMTETLALSVAAAALGILQAVWMVQALQAWLPPMLMVGVVALDVVALAFAAAVAMATTLVCGLVPAVRFSRARLRASLETRGGDVRRGRSRQLLVAVQVALSMVLLIQAAQLMLTLRGMWRTQAGFSAEAVTAMRIRGMGAGDTLGATYARFLEGIAAVPGVAAAAVSSSALPGFPGTPFSIPAQPADEAARTRQSASYQIVSPDYFSVLRIPVLAGRTFWPGETAQTAPVAVVNEALVRQHLTNLGPIGVQIRAGTGPRDATLTIVGVVGNVRSVAQIDDVPQIYVSYLQQAEPNMHVLLRSADRAVPVPVDAVKRAIWSVEPRQAVFSIQPLGELLSRSLQGGRAITILIGSFAALAAAMSMAGVFAVVSYLVARRRKEIGLRRALGARSVDVVWLLSAQTLRWTLAGLGVGIGGAVLASQALRATVPNLADVGVASVAGTTVAYLVVIAAGMVLPAVSALRIDPATAFRAE